MKIAYYLDNSDPTLLACREKSIESVKKYMPDATISCLDGEGTEGTFCEKRAYAQRINGETLFLGVDVLCQDDVSDVFDDEFDIAIATDMRPGHSDIKYNADVVFSRCTEFWDEIREKTKHLNWPVDGNWYDVEKVYTDVIDSGKYKVKILDGNIYNYVPQSKDDDLLGKKLVHYRGRRKAWMLGEDILNPVEFIHSTNTQQSVMVEQIKTNLNRKLPMLEEQPESDKPALLVGGGASLNDLSVQQHLQEKIAEGGVVFSLNATHDWLIEHDIIPDYHVMLDARPENKDFVHFPHKDVTYLVAAQCHPSVYEALSGHKIMQWVGWLPEYRENLTEEIKEKDFIVVGGGGTVGLRALSLAYIFGHRTIHCYGYDSCHRDGQSHAYQQDLNERQANIDIVCAGRKFLCSRSMAKQAQDFLPLAEKLTDMGCEINVHGDGLISWILVNLNASMDLN